MKKNLSLTAMVIVLILQFVGLIPGLSNQEVADVIYHNVTGDKPTHLELTVGD